MNAISIAPRFFLTEIQNYANHRSALVRELLQNSIDAGARNIYFNCEKDSISCKDDGIGMTRDVLTEKFLTLGATGKEGGGTIGGYGRAKLLVAFAQESYEIISHDYKVSGVGSGYSIEDNEFTNGCEFKIKTKETDWERYFNQIVAFCSFRTNIYFNGTKIENRIHRGRKIRELSFGELWVNKSPDSFSSGRLLVRVNGVLMFTRTIATKAQVILEIFPAISREVMISNRDSLVYDKQNEVDEFINEISSESISALEKKNKKVIQFVNDGSALVSRKKNKEIKTEKEIIEGFQAGQLTQIAAFMDNVAKMPQFESETVPCYQKHASWLDAAMLIADSQNPKINKVIPFYDLSVVKEGSTRLKLLKVWKTIIEFVAEKYTEKFNHEFRFGFGFTFSDSAKAQCFTRGEINYLLLNPVDESGNMAFSINKRESLAELIALAVHEVAHVRSSYHNEDFAQAMTFVMMEVLKAESELMQAIKNCK